MQKTKKLSWEELVVGEKLGTACPPFDQNSVENYKRIVDPFFDIYNRENHPNIAYNTLHAIKEYVDLPQGTVHAKESVSFHAPIEPGSPCLVELFVADRYVRRGKRGFVIKYCIYSGASHVLTAYKTFVLPTKVLDADTPQGSFDYGLFEESDQTDRSTGILLPSVETKVDQALVDRFGDATATDGPIHSDPEIATPLFGGTLLQGMFIFEKASQIMTQFSSVDNWSRAGKIAAKIIGSTVTGQTLTVEPEIVRITNSKVPRVHCSLTGRTDSGEIVFVARAEGPLTAVTISQE